MSDVESTPEERVLRDLHRKVVSSGGRYRGRGEDLMLSLMGGLRLDTATRSELQSLLSSAAIRCDPAPTDTRFTGTGPVTLWASREPVDDDPDIGDEVHGVVTSIRSERQERLAREAAQAEGRERDAATTRRRARRASTVTAAGFLAVAAVAGGAIGFLIGQGSDGDSATPVAKTVTVQADDSGRMRALATSAARQRDWDSAILFAAQAGDNAGAARYRRNGARVLERQASTALAAGDAAGARALAAQARRQYGTAASKAPDLIDQADAAIAAARATPAAPATPAPAAPVQPAPAAP